MCKDTVNAPKQKVVEITTEIKVPKAEFVNKLHLKYNIIYISIIFALVILVIIVACKQRVGETAMVNFTFAATIVSIVLAIVSIVYTLVSGGSMIHFFGKLEMIEQRLDKEVGDIAKLKNQIEEILQHTRDIDNKLTKDNTRTGRGSDDYLFNTNREQSENES